MKSVGRSVGATEGDSESESESTHLAAQALGFLELEAGIRDLGIRQMQRGDKPADLVRQLDQQAVGLNRGHRDAQDLTHARITAAQHGRVDDGLLEGDVRHTLQLAVPHHTAPKRLPLQEGLGEGAAVLGGNARQLVKKKQGRKKKRRMIERKQKHKHKSLFFSPFLSPISVQQERESKRGPTAAKASTGSASASSAPDCTAPPAAGVSRQNTPSRSCTWTTTALRAREGKGAREKDTHTKKREKNAGLQAAHREERRE